MSSSSPQNNFEEGKDALGGSFFYRSKIERTYPDGKQEKPACSPEKEQNRKEENKTNNQIQNNQEETKNNTIENKINNKIENTNKIQNNTLQINATINNIIRKN